MKSLVVLLMLAAAVAAEPLTLHFLKPGTGVETELRTLRGDHVVFRPVITLEAAELRWTFGDTAPPPFAQLQHAGLGLLLSTNAPTRSLHAGAVLHAGRYASLGVTLGHEPYLFVSSVEVFDTILRWLGWRVDAVVAL